MTRMDDEATWPLGHVLPVTRPDGGPWPRLGLLVKGEGPVVCEIALHEATPAGLRHCPRTRYASWQELAADGWRID